MKRQYSFRIRLFGYLLLVFLTFTMLIFLFQYKRERDYRRIQLEQGLDQVSLITHNYVMEMGLSKKGDYGQITELIKSLPDSNVRITLIDPAGGVLFDSEVSDHRPVIAIFSMGHD